MTYVGPPSGGRLFVRRARIRRAWQPQYIRARRMEREIALTGGRMTRGVVGVGNTIRRPIAGRGPLAHDLLHHLGRRGFNGAPRFLGIDDAGREILSFIPGVVPPELGYFTDTQLASAA